MRAYKEGRHAEATIKELRCKDKKYHPDLQIIRQLFLKENEIPRACRTQSVADVINEVRRR